MKTNAVVLIVSAGVGAALVGVGACSSMMGNKPKKVVIEDGRIFIPGTSVSQADQDSVMAILGSIRDRFTKFRLTRTAILPANRTALLRTKSSVKRPSRRLRAMPNKTLFPDGESKSVVLLHRIRQSAQPDTSAQWQSIASYDRDGVPSGSLILNAHEMRMRRHRAKWLPRSLPSCANTASKLRGR